ncbi:DUF4105 domain-containing protein [Comamonas sp. JC664]|uniref:lipoprotein N-acyltransferase Lnb domain-containing protein n=1 Tax=Comamonas sp. JC664 TaxID=2801917 RepID=UPI00191F0DB2|nr:DUF4105 domain-containing protein [Comamonas sp. JC664]MBL0699021.1 DUF4105 domain-containing protein [Comamonas sp. JC664]GHG80079.1 hypothetical protein GCM10012319_32670 [Comamonas sp. KCTC 72670]
MRWRGLLGLVLALSMEVEAVVPAEGARAGVGREVASHVPVPSEPTLGTPGVEGPGDAPPEQAQAPASLVTPDLGEALSARQLPERVKALAAAGVVLIGAAATDAGLVTEVEAGLNALPPALRRPPGGTLEFVLHAEVAPLGLGDGSPAHPDWTQGRTRFHLYRYAPSEERRATLRLSRLTDLESERLWRRRAVVHAVMQRWDDARGWSGTDAWRRLSGWMKPFERPLVWKEEVRIRYAGAFSRALGQRSASLDLVTFAEEWFVPVESLRADALPVDDQVRCQEFSKARALAEQVAASGLGDLPPRGDCPAYDAWADREALSHFEVLLVASTGRQPESLFGHLLLRPVWREGEVPRGPSFERVVQLVALTGMEAKGLGYVVKGMTGAYDTVFLTGTMGDLSHEALELEQRSVRRFRLRLNPGEDTRMLERVWELERRGYMGYYFFTDNCASALLFLLNGALEGDRQVRPPGLLWVLPTATLDTLAGVQVEGPEGRQVPLLEHVPDAFESTGDRAVRAQAARREAMESLAGHVGANELASLREVHARLQSPEPQARQGAYDDLPAVFSAVLSSARTASLDRVRERLHAYVAHTVRVERAAVDRAEGERLRIERERLLAVKVPLAGSAQAGTRERQRIFESEDSLQRRLAVLDRITVLKDAMASVPRRLPTPEELRTLVRAERTEAAFTRATEVQGALNDGPLAQVDPLNFLGEDHRRKVAAEARWAQGALRESGAARLALTVGMDFPLAGGVRPLLGLRTAAMSEALGDARLHGFQPSSELRVLDGELLLAPRWGMPKVAVSDMTLVGYRTLLRELPQFRDSFWDSLGWGAEARVSSSDARMMPYRASVQAEALVVLDENARFSRYTAVGLGGLALLHWRRDLMTPAAGPRLSVAHRTGLPGSGANAVRLEAAYAPTWRVGDDHFTHEAGATLQVELWLGRLGPFGFLLTPRAQVRWEGWVAPPTATAWWDGSAERRLALGLEVR